MLQWVPIRSGAVPQACRRKRAPRSLIRWVAVTVAAIVASAASSTAAAPSGITAAVASRLAAQVDGGGPGVGDPLDRRRQAGLVPVLFLRLAGGQGDAEGARDAEHRRAADGQPGDRVHQLVDRGEMKHADLVRERRLVDGDDMPVAPAEDLHSGPGVTRAGIHRAGIHTVTLPEEGAGDAAW